MPEESSKKRICFIINPISGRKRKRDIYKLVFERLDQEQFQIEIKYTRFARHASLLSKEAVESKTDIIVAVGGDGTINEVASELINTNTTFAIIPTGSGNGLARHLGIPRSIPKALHLINSGKFIKIDTATINEKPFISLAGVGFDALVAKIFAKNRKRGFVTYFKIVTDNFFRYKPKQYKIYLDDGEMILTRALFITFANSNQFGYNTTIAPNAKLTDGKLDVCIIQKPKVFELPLIANLLLLKKIDKSAHVKIVQSSRITVERKKNKVVNIDGEPIKLKKNLEIKVNPSSLKVIIPEYVKEK